MASFSEAIGKAPPELQPMLWEYTEALRAEKFDRIERRLDGVEAALRELAEAQRETERRLGELAEAQRDTERRLGELAEAQRDTERRMGALIDTVDGLKKMVAGLSDSVGYGLENQALKALPALLERDFAVRASERLVRTFVAVPGKEVEVDVWGRAEREGRPIRIVGEGKTHLTQRDVNRFLKKLDLLRRHRDEELFPVLVAHAARPDAAAYARERGAALYYSYDL